MHNDRGNNYYYGFGINVLTYYRNNYNQLELDVNMCEIRSLKGNMCANSLPIDDLHCLE